MIHRSEVFYVRMLKGRPRIHTLDRRADRGWGMFVLVDLHSMMGDIMCIYMQGLYGGGTGIPPSPEM